MKNLLNIKKKKNNFKIYNKIYKSNRKKKMKNKNTNLTQIKITKMKIQIILY